MKWLELKIDAAPAGLEPVSALLEDLGITGLVIDDEGDFQDFLEHNHAYWDYVDDQLMQEKKGLCRITFYLEDSPDGYNTLAQVRMALSRVKQEHPEYGRLLLTMENMEDADWENNWKQFYKPMEIGERLLVVPEWEQAEEDGRVKLVLNPGLTFGTGSHDTTQLCMCALEDNVKPGDTVLDMGTGSGILAIAAAMLGAEVKTVVDIDENCLRTAQENAEKNHVSIGRGLCGDALRDEKLAADIGSGYSVIVANIVADVIIGMAPMFFAKTAEGGTLICSGILNERADEVRAALEKAGFEVVNHAKSDDWSAFTAKK